MHAEIYERVRKNPLFHELVKRRSRLAVTLSVIVLGTYYAFIMAVAFAPEILRAPISDDSPVSWGIPMGALLIIAAWLLTGLYSFFANGEFEELNKKLVQETME